MNFAEIPRWMVRLLRLALTTAVLTVTPAWAAKEDKPPAIDAPAKAKPGAVGLVTAAGKGMRYFLRVPKRYDAAKGARLIVFLHGSNMNGLSYLRSFEAKKWCDDDILCCPNGEDGGDPYGNHNFGFESGAAVADVITEVQKAFKTTVTYIGGHSQGAFLTYNILLNHPELCHGAFPMAGDCWIQNEPNLWETKPDVLAKQKDIAIAVIHGQADPVVPFSQGQHAYDCFRAMGWTKLRLFSPKALNHMFMQAPIDEAIEWLDTVNGLNEKKGATLAGKWAKDGEWGWAWNAMKASKMPGGAQKAAEDAATKAIPAITTAMKGDPAAWVPQWIEFWRIHGETKAAQPLVTDYLAKRAAERDAAVRLFNESQAAFRSEKKDAAYAALERLLREAPHTYQAVFAAQWLKERK